MKKEFLINLGKNIRSIRESKDIKLRDLADKTLIQSSNLLRIEKGKTNPTVLTLLKISNGLNVNPSELLSFHHI